MLGLGLSLWNPQTAYRPERLFVNGEVGAIYDPSDTGTLWQDSARTVPVTADGDPVGAIDDKSGNGRHATQATASARPLYRASSGLRWLEFDGVDDTMSAGAASDWAWAHQQGGVTFGVAAEVSHRTDALEFLLGTMSGASSTDTGVVLNSDNRDIVGNPRNTRVQIARGVAGQVAASFIEPSPHDTKVWTYVTQASGLTLNTRQAVYSGSWQNPTSTGDPSLALFLGGAASNRLNGKFFGAVVLDRAVSSVEEDRLRRFLAAKAGVTL